MNLRTRRRALVALAALIGGLSAVSAPAQRIEFVDVTRQAGLYKPLEGIMGHGAAWGDLDADGDPDVYVGGYADRPDGAYRPAPGPVANKLFRNRGDGTFEPLPAAATEIFARTSGAVFADLDNNGTLDLYVANNCKGRIAFDRGLQRDAQLCRCKLFRNDGGALLDESARSGACPRSLGTARNVGVFDYDADGLLDLFVVEDRFAPGPSSMLFRNLGGLRFRDVSREAGLPEDLFGLGLAVADLNDDGRPDFFVGHSHRLFLSTGDGRYREPPELAGVFAWEPLHNEDWPCGVAFGDLNVDGRPDLVIGIHSDTARNRVYLNRGLKRGVPRFEDVTASVGFPAAVPVKCPHVEIQDFDNDGRPDVYFSAAWLDADGRVTPLVFRNMGVRGGLPRFAPPRRIEAPMVYYSTGPSADYDADGRIDLFLVNWYRGNHCRLMKNDCPPRNWLDVRVTGGPFNRMGIGSKVWVYEAGRLGRAGSLLGFQEIQIGYGYAAGQEAVCHFGLGDASAVDVRVRLPDGTVVNRHSVAANTRLVIESP